MKYFVRLLAALPMLGTGISMIVFVVMAFENPLWILEAIASFYSFMVCATHYEDTVRHLAIFIKLMAKDALGE
jgi:hypothetical protein